jgi:hypothetical protein
MQKSTVTRRVGTIGLGLGLAAALGTPAFANHGSPPVKGTCSGSSTVKLYTSEHGKGIKVTAKIKTGVAGEAWDWTISDNGSTVAADESVTNADNKLIVRATVPNLEGSDTIDFSATDTVTGEVCTAEDVVG